jgi:hypothetical protein
MMSEQKATPQDAQVILQLFELRREAEMRKARRWVEMEFWPRSAQDYIEISMAYGTEPNTWLRMVGGYWEMAASFVNRGALNATLFHDSNFEMYFLYAKFSPFLAEIRKYFEMPELFGQVEQVIQNTPGGRERLTAFRARIEKFAKEREKLISQRTSAAG